MSEDSSGGFDFLDTGFGEDNAEVLSPKLELAPGQIDPRFTRLSYSGLLDLHACPRLFQLNKLQAESVVDLDSQITFAYGHAIGTGIQTLLITKDLDEAILEAYLNWSPDLLAIDEKRGKSIFHAVAALAQFKSMLDSGFLEDYDVAVFEDKPAAELSFRIWIGEFSFRGYVDVVMRRKWDGEKTVIECKTDSANYVSTAKYKNSSQAIGYSVVLDKIEAGESAYSVEYLIQMTRLQRYESFSFPKSYEQRALWLRDILYDVETIKGYVEREGNYGIWPMRGESCMRFNRPCQHLDMCQLPTDKLGSPAREIHLVDRDRKGKEVQYQFDMTLAELIESGADTEIGD